MSETVTMTLTDFLLARIAEDEAELHPEFDAPGRSTFGTGYDPDSANVYSSYYLTVDPARIRAECEAKRRIVEECGHLMERVRWPDSPGALALQHLAAVYADHPDYREDWWRP